MLSTTSANNDTPVTTTDDATATAKDAVDPADPTTAERTAVEGLEPTTDGPEPTVDDDTEDTEPDTFPREVVEKLRRENAKYRDRAKGRDDLAQRLHVQLVAATGKLADPTDLAYAEAHLDDPEALAAAIDTLLEAKPHLASRRPVGDIGQGRRGSPDEPFTLLGLLKDRT